MTANYLQLPIILTLGMKIIIRKEIYEWLIQMEILKEVSFQTDEPYQEVLYDDQMYLENGYIVGQLLRKLLKAHSHFSQQLLKLRKIAFITSNENWTIIRDVMINMGFENEIQVHSVKDKTIIAILEYLFETFGISEEEKAKKKKRKLHIDPITFDINKNYEECSNLLQFSILLLHNSFQLQLSDCLGLLINQSIHLKTLIRNGTTNSAFDPVIKLYRSLLSNIETFTSLIQEQPLHFDQFMEGIGQGVISEDEQVIKLCNLLYENVGDGKWMQQRGYWKLLQSDLTQCLELLVRKIKNDFSIIFNTGLANKFKNKVQMMRIFNKIICYLPKCHYQQQVIAALQLDYYLSQALQTFDNQNLHHSSSQMRIASREVITSLCSHFWSKLAQTNKIKLLQVYDPVICKSYFQKHHCIASLFTIVSKQLIQHDTQVDAFLQLINRHYQRADGDLRNFILHNVKYTYIHLKQYFPIGFFIENYIIAPYAQSIDFQLFYEIAKDEQLLSDEVNSALRSVSVYFMEQLHAYCFIEIIKNMIKHKKDNNINEWGLSMSNELLKKYVTLDVPPPPKTPIAKLDPAKLRSICSKKKEMIKYHDYHKLEQILNVLTSVKDKEFLKAYDKQTESAIIFTQKDKRIQSKVTKKSLINLINKIRKKLDSIRDQTMDWSVYSSPSSKNSNHPPLYQYSLPLQPQIPKQKTKIENITPYSLSKGEFEENQFISDLDQNIKESESIKQSQRIEQEEERIPQCTGLLPFSSDQSLEMPINYYSDSILENYESIYIKTMKQKYKELIRSCLKVYQQNSQNLQAFFSAMDMKNYVKSDLQSILSMEDKCKYICDDTQELMGEILIQTSLIIFNFKKNRRITVTCIQSFFNILSEKIKKHSNMSESRFNEEINNLSIGQSVQFQHLISNQIKNNNQNLSKYSICFQIVDSLLGKALNFHNIEPISKIRNQFSSPVKIKEKELTEKEQNEMQQLQNMIETDESPTLRSPTIFKKTKVNSQSDDLKEIPPKSIDQIKKVAQLRNKLMKRRHQIQKTIPQKSINDQKQ